MEGERWRAAQDAHGHSSTVWSLAFSPGGRWLASGSDDRSVRLWRLDMDAPVRTLNGHSQAVLSVAFSPDAEWLASGGEDSRVILSDEVAGAPRHRLTQDSRHVHAVAFSPDARYLASGSRDKGTFGELVQKVAGARLAGGRTETIRLWRVEDGTLLQSLSGHADDIVGLQFSPDGRRLASCGGEGAVVLWRLGP